MIIRYLTLIVAAIIVTLVFAGLMTAIWPAAAAAQPGECKPGSPNCLCDNEETGNSCYRKVWYTDCRHGRIHKKFTSEEMNDPVDNWPPPVEISGSTVHISYDELRNLMKDLPRLMPAKACDAYSKCLQEREAGKVKHCYQNDRRWREYFHHGW